MAEDALARARAIALRLSGGIAGSSDLGKRKNRFGEDEHAGGRQDFHLTIFSPYKYTNIPIQHYSSFISFKFLAFRILSLPYLSNLINKLALSRRKKSISP